MVVFIVIIVIFAVLAAGFFIGSRIAYGMSFERRGDGKPDPYVGLERESFLPYSDKIRASIDRLSATPCEEIRIKSHDGLTLFGRYYHVRDGAPTEIQFHGYRSVSLKDFSGGGCAALDSGFNLLLVDQRAHGESEGRTISFGINERLDCIAWARYLDERFGGSTPIVLVGVSMGAATVLMASELELPESVVCAVADCPYSTPKDIIIKVANGMGLPGRLLFPLVRAGARMYGGFSIMGGSPVAAAAGSRLPTMIIHGDSDGFVPCEMSGEIFDAIPHENKSRVIFEGADHGLSFIVDQPRYVGLVNEFIRDSVDRWNEKRGKK